MSRKRSNEGSKLDEVRAAKSAAHGAFERLAKVVGIGITRHGNGYALKVNLQRAPGATVVLPKEIAGVPVHVEVVGPIRKRLAA